MHSNTGGLNNGLHSWLITPSTCQIKLAFHVKCIAVKLRVKIGRNFPYLSLCCFSDLQEKGMSVHCIIP